MGGKFGGLGPFVGGCGSPSNTMWPWWRPTTIPSGILIHPTIWPQYANVTYRTDQTDYLKLFQLSNTGLHGHSYKLFKPQVQLHVRSIFFRKSVIHKIVCYPQELLQCRTVENFKIKLNFFLKKSDFNRMAEY